MRFLNPWLLLGLSGISLPILIHLLNRFRYRDIEWAAMELLRRALVVRSRRVRLEDMILLVLRCAAVALLALAIARPTLAPQGSAAWLAGEPGVGALIAIDCSFSMGHKPGVYSRFDRAAERVREVLDSLRPGEPITLVTLGNRPRVLLRNTPYDAQRVAALLQTVAPLPERLNLETCLAEIEGLLAEIKAPWRECYLVSDNQASDWGQLSDQARASLRQIASLGRTVLLPLSDGPFENLAVTQLEWASGMVRRGALARYAAAVANLGRTVRERITVTLYAGEKAVDQRVIARIEPGKTETVPLFIRFDQPGAVRLSARIAADDLPIDNACYAVANVRPQTRVLCVEGAPPADGGGEEASYLCTALVPRESDASQQPIDVDRIAWPDLSGRRLADYQVVILVDVPELREDQAQTLGQFVSAGGGLIVFLGPNTQPAVLNKCARFEGGCLLPGTILTAVDAASDRSSHRSLLPVAGHPLARAVAGLSQDLLAEAQVHRFFPLELGTGGQAVVKIGGGPTDVLVAEKPLGRGHTVLFTTTADRQWADLVTHPSFPILVQEALTYLGRQADERALRVGAPLVLPLPLAGDTSAAETISIREPGGAVYSVRTVRRDGQVLAEFGPTEQAGFYEVRYASEAAPLPVNVDTAESDVRCLAAGALGDSLKNTGVSVVRESDDLRAAIRSCRSGREIWRELLLAAMVLLLVEGYLAYRFTRRARPTETIGCEVGSRKRGLAPSPR